MPIGNRPEARLVQKRFTLDALEVEALRNLARVDLEPSPGVNVISGDNGHGKTSLLEAIYLLATSHSFRTAKLGELVQHGATVGSVRGSLAEHWHGAPIARRHSVGLEGSRRHVKLDGKRPRSLGWYATRSPVVVFDAKQLALSTGPASERRTLLDRVMLFTDPDSADHRARYARALRERQRLLADRPAGAGGADVEVYERILAEHGAALTAGRARAVELVARDLLQAFGRIGAPELSLSVTYQSGGSADVEEMARRLAQSRYDDAVRKRSGYGPHRDDMAIELDGHPARVVASQGQHRAITLALKSAELRCIAAARGLEPILLLDDVSSELDAERTTAFFDYLATTDSQIFLTTTRRGLIVTGARRRDFVLRRGTVEAG